MAYHGNGQRGYGGLPMEDLSANTVGTFFKQECE